MHKVQCQCAVYHKAISIAFVLHYCEQLACCIFFIIKTAMLFLHSDVFTLCRYHSQHHEERRQRTDCGGHGWTCCRTLSAIGELYSEKAMMVCKMKTV